MKRILLIAVSAAFLTLHAVSQNSLTFHLNDGQKVSFAFNEKPVITYADSTIILKTIGTEVLYPLSLLSKITFTDPVITGDVHVDDTVFPKLVLSGYDVFISGGSPLTHVSVIGADGRLLVDNATDESGCVSFSISELPDGVYVIKSVFLTCKILKK